MSFQETAAFIERFLNHESLYPQEWNDFVETSQSSKKSGPVQKALLRTGPARELS